MEFKDKDIEAFWNDQNVIPFRVPPDLQRRLYHKLQYLDSAESLYSLRRPASNHLEALKGKRKGQFSIRINDKWRICFTWNNNEAREIEFCDYH